MKPYLSHYLSRLSNLILLFLFSVLSISGTSLHTFHLLPKGTIPIWLVLGQFTIDKIESRDKAAGEAFQHDYLSSMNGEGHASAFECDNIEINSNKYFWQPGFTDLNRVLIFIDIFISDRQTASVCYYFCTVNSPKSTKKLT